MTTQSAAIIPVRASLLVIVITILVMPLFKWS
jgi:hypothetical protein